MNHLFFLASLLASLGSTLSIGGNIRLYSNFDASAPLINSQWDAIEGTIDADVEAGLFLGSNLAPHYIRTDIPYCLGDDFVLQMNAKVQYNASLVNGLITSQLGWNQDPFYGCAFVGAMNEDGWRFQFLITQFKVYALYAHYYPLATKTLLPTDARFAFIVPIADRQPGDADDYSVNMKADEFDVSWRINNVEKLLVRNVGQSIAGKFMVWSNAATNQYYQVSFPAEMYMEVGVGSMADIGPIGQPRTVCQLTTFDQCTSSILSAPRCFCRYGAPQYGGWEVDEQASVSNLFIARLSNVSKCRDNMVQDENSTADRWWTQNL